MALANILSRRAILKGVPAAIVVGAVPVAAIAAIPAQTAAEQIQHHAAEIERLLRETMPEGAFLTNVQWFVYDDSRPCVAAACRTVQQQFHMHTSISPNWKPNGKAV